MLFRDILNAWLWLACKSSSLAFCAMSYWMCIDVVFFDGAEEPGDVVPMVLLGLAIGSFFLWVFSTITAIPLLLWRYRKYHVFRWIQNSKGHMAIQVRLYGIWFYVPQNEEYLVLSACVCEELSIWKYWDDDTNQYHVNRQIERWMNKITPDRNKNTSDPIIYENYLRKTES